MPAYNADRTLEKTYRELPFDIVDEVILVDDCSSDETSNKAIALGFKHVIRHDENMGYGANQKTCYKKALELKADVVIMLHPDYQYEPKLVTAMASLVAEEIFDCVLGSRILGTGAIKGGMPIYKYIANRSLTAYQTYLFRINCLNTIQVIEPFPNQFWRTCRLIKIAMILFSIIKCFCR